jgi:hypothetical protein
MICMRRSDVKLDKSNLSSGHPFNVRGGLKRESPPAWFKEKYARYWVL